jgi:L-iditol 2-dehydrogenase
MDSDRFGLGAVVCATVRGARVIGIESNPYRARLAQDLGAESVVDPTDPDALNQIRSLTRGGADKSVEASSHPDAPGFLLQATRIGGQMTSIGWGGPVNMRDVVARGVGVFGQWHWNHLQDAAAMFDTIRRASPLLERLISHRFPMSQVQDAWELQLTGQCGKVVLTP